MATARIGIWYQEAHCPDVPGLHKLVGELRDYYRTSFINGVAVPSRTEDRITSVIVRVHRLDPLDYEWDAPTISIAAEFPTSVSGKPEAIIVPHSRFVDRWLADIERGLQYLLVDTQSRIRIPIEIRFGTVHEAVVRVE